MNGRVLITSALPYANGQLHFGHMAGAYLPADCFARFKRLKQNDVLFISGSDEYGIAITLSAELAGRTPKEQVDYFHKENVDLFKKLNISFDHYSRTTCKKHAPLVQDFFLTLLKNGYIEEKIVEQLYSEEEGRFLADRYVIGICPKCGFEEARGDECTKCGGNYEATDLKFPKSKLTKSNLTLKKTKHWFFKCNLFKDKLIKFLEKKDWRPNVTNFVKPYIDEFHERCITRDLEWGVPLPIDGAHGKVLYVWFDAPIGYISATQEWAENIGEVDAWKKYWLDPETKYVQFIGKDNIVFHAMIFPAMVMGQDINYNIVDNLEANEFLTIEGKRFSKSTGWNIDLKDFLTRYTSDTLRYTLAANAPENQDSEFTFKDFQMRVNNELVGKLGNFIHRTLTFIIDRMEQKIPECHDFSSDDDDFLDAIRLKLEEAEESFENCRLRKAALSLIELSSAANAYFDLKKPWNLLKDKESKKELETTMYCCLTAIKAIALIASPIIPESADKIWKMLGFAGSISTQSWDVVIGNDLIPGKNLPHPKILFSKIDDEAIQCEISKLTNMKTPITHANLKEIISIDDFSKLDLRVGRIEKAETIQKSKKLLKLIVDLGFEKRTILSGIAQSYENPEELIGKRVIVVANLKKIKLMGIESEGMILAASFENFLELPSIKDAPEGTQIS